jgi:flagellar basal-body rod protein FlgF
MNITEIAAAGLQQDIERLRVASHNVANITTPGYKRQIAVQSAALQSTFANAINSERATQSAMNTHTDISAGKLRPTGNPLDVALNDREFLLVQAAAGGAALSRGGALQVDSRGRLTTSAGLLVQGASGELAVPSTASAVRIESNGQVFADDRLIGSLRVMRLGAGVQPVALGEGLFTLANMADAQAVPMPQLNVGHTEASNVVSSQEMVMVMASTRHAESMARLIQGADEMLEKTIRKLGEM